MLSTSCSSKGNNNKIQNPLRKRNDKSRLSSKCQMVFVDGENERLNAITVLL